MSAVLHAAIAGPQPQAVPRKLASLGISIRGVSKSYAEFTALDNVSLEVAAGEFLTLLGPSGSGKTTLLNIIAGFVRADGGALCFGSEDVTHEPVNRRGLGMVFQNYALFPHMTVAQNVAFPLKVRRLPAAEIRDRVAQVLDLVQLGHLAHRNVTQISGGQRQRVALARAVVFSPRIVLMDEPLSALDKNLREQMQVEIRHLHEKIGATTIYVTHDQREALTMSDRIAVMNQGRIVQCDSPQAVYEQPASAFVANFVGETTLLPVTVTGTHEVRTPDGTPLTTLQPVPGATALHLVLRAERLLLPAECGAAASRLRAVVRDVIYQGDSVLILLEMAAVARPVAMRRPLRGSSMGDQPRVGDSILVGLDPGSVRVVSD